MMCHRQFLAIWTLTWPTCGPGVGKSVRFAVVSCTVNCSVIVQRLFSATWSELLIVSGGDTRKTCVRKVMDPCCEVRRELSWRWNCVWCNKAYTCCEFTSNHCQVAARVVSEPSFLISACRIFGITQLLLCITDECFRRVSETFSTPFATRSVSDTVSVWSRCCTNNLHAGCVCHLYVCNSVVCMLLKIEVEESG